MKKITAVTLVGALTLGASLSAFAGPGFYLGGNAGYGKVDEKADVWAWDRQHGDKNNGGFAFSGNVGYQFTDFFGLEVGANRFADINLFNKTIQLKDNYSFDLAAKGILPLGNNVSLFGKLGVAAVHQNLTVNIPHTNSTIIDRANYKHNNYRTAAYGAAGVEYALSPNVGINVQVHGTTKTGPVPAMYAGLAGLTFHFN